MGRRWRCQLGHKNKKIFLGYFNDAAEAARLEAACAFTEGHFAQAATLFSTLASRVDLPLEGGERDGLRQWARRSRAFEAAAQR